MKSAGWLLVLAACASPPAPTTPTTTLISECPSCPTCNPQVCPTCPECPQLPPEPVARDWYCMELDPPFKQVKSFCWSSSSVCESYREKTGKDTKNYGKPSACTAQRIAYCYYHQDPITMGRQMRCARTLEDCQRRRQQTIDEPATETVQSSACERALNTDTFTYKNAGNDL